MPETIQHPDGRVELRAERRWYCGAEGRALGVQKLLDPHPGVGNVQLRELHTASLEKM